MTAAVPSRALVRMTVRRRDSIGCGRMPSSSGTTSDGASGKLPSATGMPGGVAVVRCARGGGVTEGATTDGATTDGVASGVTPDTGTASAAGVALIHTIPGSGADGCAVRPG